MSSDPIFVTVQGRGLVAIPPAIRRRLGLDRPGMQVEVTEADGVITLRPHVPVPADQSWFWTKRWQKMEREADAAVEAGQVSAFKNVEGLLADLDS